MAFHCGRFAFLFFFAFSFINLPTNVRSQKTEMVVVDIQNALPNNTQTAALTLWCGGASLVLKLGDHHTESVKMDQSLGCTALWLPFFTSWDAFEVSRDKGHQNIYWLVKKDGFYHSWDKSSWKKLEEWRSE